MPLQSEHGHLIRNIYASLWIVIVDSDAL